MEALKVKRLPSSRKTTNRTALFIVHGKRLALFRKSKVEKRPLEARGCSLKERKRQWRKKKKKALHYKRRTEETTTEKAPTTSQEKSQVRIH